MHISPKKPEEWLGDIYGFPASTYCPFDHVAKTCDITLDISHQLNSYQQKPMPRSSCIWDSFPAPSQVDSTVPTVAESFPARRCRAYLFDQNIRDQGGLRITTWMAERLGNSMPSHLQLTGDISFPQLQVHSRGCYLSYGWLEFLQQHAVSVSAAPHTLLPGASPQTTETHKPRALMEVTPIHGEYSLS